MKEEAIFWIVMIALGIGMIAGILNLVHMVHP